MSMVRCDECEHLIDSDDDPDCFGEDGNAPDILCDNCRQNAAERAWERQQEGEPPISDRERYESAWHEHQRTHR